MAGIGFLLRKLASKDDFSGIIRAFFHSAIVAVGPWILIVVCLGAISLLSYPFVGIREVNEFQSIIMYNFVFSLILAYPLYMISARFVADCLYRKDASPIPSILLTNMIMLLIPAVILSTIFYVFYVNLPPISCILSIINFVLLSAIWIAMLYLGCIRNFRAITACWLTGIGIATFLAVYFGNSHGSTGMLLGIDLGLIFLLYAQQANVFAEFPFRYQAVPEFRFYFRKYIRLFWSGFFLFAGMWIDKIIMWGAPEAITHLNHLRTYPIYDGGMFIAYLSIIPVMALFIFSLETNFYDSYIRYVQHIERNAPLVLIEEEKTNIAKKIIENGRSFLVLQGSCSLLVIAVAPIVFPWIGIDFLEIGIFRLGVLGAFFNALTFFIFIFFLYFDNQIGALRISMMMFFSNALLTVIFEKLGFSFYGLGYCLSMIVTFFVAAILFIRLLDKLNYHIFITNTVKRQNITNIYEDLLKES